MQAPSRPRIQQSRFLIMDGKVAQRAKSNLGTVTDPRTGEEVVFVPKRRAMNHQHASAGRPYELLRDYERRYFGLSSQRSAGCHDTDAPWHRLVDQGDCSAAGCPTSKEEVRVSGMLLPSGRLLCRLCHHGWAEYVSGELGYRQGERCPKNTDGQCLGCTFENRDSRISLRRLLIRGHLRDLVHALYSHLPANVQGHMSCSLTASPRRFETNSPTRIMPYSLVLRRHFTSECWR